jgi:hypothetical protein
MRGRKCCSSGVGAPGQEQWEFPHLAGNATPVVELTQVAFTPHIFIMAYLPNLASSLESMNRGAAPGKAWTGTVAQEKGHQGSPLMGETARRHKRVAKRGKGGAIFVSLR